MSKVSRALITLLFSLVLTICVSAAEAEPLDYYVTTYFPGDNTFFDVKKINDNDVSTSSTLPGGLSIELSTVSDNEVGPTSIGYVYVKFATTPTSYKITYNNTVGTVAYDTGGDDMRKIRAGENGFLHDLAVIEGDVSSIMISSEQDMEIADILLYSKGELPDGVQRWEPTLTECDMLCFPTHADDEALYMGALISESVARGRFVQVALICNDKKSPERLHELLDAVWTLGIRTYPIIGNFPDLYSKTLKYASTQYDSDEMRGFIVECIRRTKPSVVVGHDIDGEYGHGAHMLTSLLVREAIELTGDSESYPDSAQKYGLHNIKKLFLHLYEENNIKLDVRHEYDELGGRSPFDMAVEAFDCHKSQHKFDELVVSTIGTDDCSSFGLFYSSVGYDVSSGDIFEGVARVAPSLATMLDTDKSSTPSSLSKTTPMHLPENNGTPESVRNAFAHTGVGFCLFLAALMILYGIITARRRRR